MLKNPKWIILLISLLITINFITVSQEIIIDNTDAGYTEGGIWVASTYNAGYYGTNYKNDNTAGADDSSIWAKWTPNIPSDGDYQIYMRWPAAANRPNAAPLETGYNGGANIDSSKNVNQQQNGGTWNR